MNEEEKENMKLLYTFSNKYSSYTAKAKNSHLATKDDEAFLAPEMNAFSRQFRDYDAESERQKSVEAFYKAQHINQTVAFVTKMRADFGKLDKKVMSIWECCELLNEVVDESDPDLDEPQIQHLLQSAEAIRKDYPNEDWLHLTALIHVLFRRWWWSVEKKISGHAGFAKGLSGRGT
ncbi:inositol oxygenase 4 isoform X1 [Arabidopsis lyrata subsp. lyrata]|nr:inositol oxygenase 4 isoform X1 [Arabidopsis lyrata subsp. lyrata]|eukprot:XP_020873771.1 inositol oxygenase 4 isoform X1 [Arabidopsis lyrata subsp. lyrata]